jgi:hypothetical protein
MVNKVQDARPSSSMRRWTVHAGKPYHERGM